MADAEGSVHARASEKRKPNGMCVSICARLLRVVDGRCLRNLVATRQNGESIAVVLPLAEPCRAYFCLSRGNSFVCLFLALLNGFARTLIPSTCTDIPLSGVLFRAQIFGRKKPTACEIKLHLQLKGTKLEGKYTLQVLSGGTMKFAVQEALPDSTERLLQFGTTHENREKLPKLVVSLTDPFGAPLGDPKQQAPQRLHYFSLFNRRVSPP
eukprot:6177357-Pleurochrysis_carterae.AAC.4